jgi:NAD(P)-dependent dehydrogenase (short-subunit alcohol dehydrogenase family)
MKLQVVVVGGAFGTLGQAIASAFAAGGARLALLDAGAPTESVLAQFAQGSLLLGNVDLADTAEAGAAMASVARQYGGIDVLVNVAGGFHWGMLEQDDIASWDLMYRINLRTALVGSKAALPYLLRAAPGSRIINIGAAAASRPAAAGMGAYTAAKAGVQKFTESLADELKQQGVTVNAVLPGTIDTPQNRASMPDADFSRWVAPAAIADVVTFLASRRASAVTGAAINVLGSS